MAEKKDLSALPQFLKPEVAERAAEHFKDGVFEFGFDTEEHIAVEGNTVSATPSSLWMTDSQERVFKDPDFRK